ncbi:ABC transporter substrate-binding protein [Streptomyces caeruleatus]|uniref:ABC transporter substrate-binding protein n=1 Tax=Streptomyces caeruleatus TaxID=661399 RepID=A0A117RMR8_9ACTN|nr:ABC transporter substrate-binding protein [Streptomyces caeruleatus]
MRRGRAVLAAAVLPPVVAVALSLGGCGSGGSGSAEGGFKVGLLLSQNVQTRWERFDKPLIEKRVTELCARCTVEYANAEGDVATQKQQVETMINRDVEVLLLSAVNFRSLRSSVERAHDAGIPVIAYDGLVEGPVSAHVSFDNERVGRLQGEALLRALGNRADKADSGQVVMMNGPQTSPTNVAFKKGALSVLQGEVRIVKSYDTPGWSQETAHTNMDNALAALGTDSVDGVYAANDGLAAGVISALKNAGIDPLPPVTGQDADLAAVQRVVLGEQYMSVYKPFKAEADAAARIAVALGRGDDITDLTDTTVDTATTKHIPAVQLDPVPVTVADIRSTVVEDGVYTVDQICAPELAAACRRAGLTE